MAVTNMFKVLRTSPPTSLPATAAQTLARLSASSRGRRVDVDAAQARAIGPRHAALYLVPGKHGICAVRGTRGACSADLDALSEHGLRFWVLHRHNPKTGRTPVEIYGALPDGLGAISAQPWLATTVVGTNAHHNGYRLHLADRAITAMYLTGPRGAATLGPLTHPG